MFIYKSIQRLCTIDVIFRFFCVFVIRFQWLVYDCLRGLFNAAAAALRYHQRQQFMNLPTRLVYHTHHRNGYKTRLLLFAPSARTSENTINHETTLNAKKKKNSPTNDRVKMMCARAHQRTCVSLSMFVALAFHVFIVRSNLLAFVETQHSESLASPSYAN